MQTSFSSIWISRRAHLFGLISAPLYDGAGDGGAGGQGGGTGAGAGGTGAGAGTGSGDGSSGDGGGTGGGDTVTMTQAELQELIRGRIGAELAKHEKKRANVSSEEIETLRKFKQEKEREDLERKGKYDEALKSVRESVQQEYEPRVKEFETKITGLTGRLRTEIVTNKLLAAAATGNAYNAEQVVGLNDRFVTIDEDWNPVVVDKDGKERFISGVRMTPEQLVQEFLKNNPHMVKAGNTGQGGGAKGGASREGQDMSDVQKLEAELEELRKQYAKTRDVNVMAAFQRKAMELKAAKAKAA